MSRIAVLSKCSGDMSLFICELKWVRGQCLGAMVKGRVTDTLCARGWWDVKSRYLSVWVDFLNTDVDLVPSGWWVISTSRNIMDWLDSFSTVNWICGLIELR